MTAGEASIIWFLITFIVMAWSNYVTNRSWERWLISKKVGTYDETDSFCLIDKNGDLIEEDEDD